MNISQVLERAARLLESVGWCQHTGKTLDGRRCAYIAIKHFSTQIMPVEFLTQFLGVERISSWNDEPGRTGPEVATWLSSAAEYARMRRL